LNGSNVVWGTSSPFTGNKTAIDGEANLMLVKGEN
jgi:hypothetical protein